MKLVLRVLHVLATIVLGLAGLIAGAGVGYANGGWIGAVAIGAVGLMAGVFLATGGWGLLLGLLF